MKVMVFVKATPNSEKGLLPDAEMQVMFEKMGKFNEQLVKAGIMKDADGLKPSNFGKRVHFTGDEVTVVDGPFAETKELVAGYWIWEVKSVDEAVSWAKRCPNPMPGEEGILEIRPAYTMEDFGTAATDEIRENEARLRKQVEKQQKPKAKKAAPKPKAKAKAKSKSVTAKRKPARAKSKK